MTISKKIDRARPLPVALAAILLAGPAFAQVEAPVPDKGDTSWMLISSALVLMMTVPGLALFYGGMVRAKNILSVLTQVFVTVAVVALLWVSYGYSLAFTGSTESLTPFVGGFSKAFLSGVTSSSVVETFSAGVVIPEMAFIAFQMTFACITPALIVGAFAERIRFPALLLFVVLWVTLVYFPMAHMVWFWGGPSLYADPAGLIFSFGALDFAGGTVVHINSGIAGLVGAVIIGQRLGYGREALAPHSLTFTMIGAALLWVGWFGFNAGSNLEANGSAALAFLNTFVAPAAAALGWMLVEWLIKGKPSLLGIVSGVVAGLVAITPAAGFSGPMGAIVLGFVAGVVCFFFCTGIKNALGYDDSLDVFGVHAVGGIVGAIGTGIVVSPALGGAGIFDYATGTIGYPGVFTQVMSQVKGVLVTILWSGVISAALYILVDFLVGLRVSEDEEREGLDITAHGERAYTT